MIEAKVIADSVSEAGKRITTLQLTYPRFIHAEFMTHRMFSRNASSSRAIPVKTILKQVWNDPAMPVHWGANQPGMQARAELQGFKRDLANWVWRFSGKVACLFAWSLTKIGLHKQIANRVLEPWQNIHVVVTATEWGNFYSLRDHEDAQPEIRTLAVTMKHAMDNSKPKVLHEGEWHLPYSNDSIAATSKTLKNPFLPLKSSAARCARVSYLKHDGRQPSLREDLNLYDKLVGSMPIHASPTEHQATPLKDPEETSGNFVGWKQYRKVVEQQFAR